MGTLIWLPVQNKFSGLTKNNGESIAALNWVLGGTVYAYPTEETPQKQGQ